MDVIRKHTIDLADVSVDLVEEEAPQWDGVSSFDLGDQVIRNHVIYVSTIDANVGIDPLNEDQLLVGVRWLMKGYTNAFRFLDGTISNRSQAVSSVSITLDNLAGVDAIVLFGLTGINVSITGKTISDAVIFQQTENISGREVTDWLDWFYLEFSEYSDKVVITGLPSGISQITIVVTGSSIEVGELIVGNSVDIGKAQVNGTEGEAISYTTTEFNTYGVLNNVKRPVRNEMRYSVYVSSDRWRSIKPLMDRMQGDLVAAIGSPSRPSTVHLGILGAVRWKENLPDGYIFQFTLRGTI